MKTTRGTGLLENYLAKKRAAKANSLIEERMRSGKILDIGCGNFPYFLATTDFKEKFGLDPYAKDEMFAKTDIKLVKMERNKLPFKENTLDVVTMLAVFEHLEPEGIVSSFKDIKRVLKIEGQLIITTPSPISVVPLSLMSKFNLVSKEEIHDHKSSFSKQKIEQLILKSGFSKKKIKSGYFEFGFNMWFTAKK